MKKQFTFKTCSRWRRWSHIPYLATPKRVRLGSVCCGEGFLNFWSTSEINSYDTRILIWTSVSSPEEPSAIHAYRAITKSSITNIPHSINRHSHHHNLRHHHKSNPVIFLVLLCVELVSKKGWSISIHHRFIGYIQWSNNRPFACPPIHTWWLTKRRKGL